MDNPLAPWRDLSIVWLILWTMLFVAIPGVVLYFAQLYLRKFNRWLRLPLLHAQVWALRIQQGTARVSDRVAAVPIAMHSAGTRARTTARLVVDALKESRGNDGTTIRPPDADDASQRGVPENS